jgi:hypothetical protein
MKKIGVLMALIALLAVGVAYGDGAFVTPLDDGTVRGSYVFNVSCSLTNSTNASITGSSALTGDTLTATNLFSDDDSGNDDNSTNASVSTLGFVDATDWTFTGTCYNVSGASEPVTAITGVTVDNTVPVCGFTNPVKSNFKYAATQTYTIGCANATSATIAFGSNPSKAMTEKSDVCTYTGTKQSVPEAVYNKVLVTTNDGTNTTTCQLDWITIDPGAPLKAAGALLASEGQKQSGAPTSNNTIVYVIIAAAVGYWYINRKK